MITNEIMFRAGQRDARELRAAAHGMTGTEIIAREISVPPFDPEKDYTDWPVGGPVADEGQVWTLIQPHNAAHFPGLRPSGNRANWGLTHTKDPAKAKPWVDPFGTSGLYLKDECYLDKQGRVHRCLVEQTNFDAVAMPSYWEDVAV